jgi:hypothetical protein
MFQHWAEIGEGSQLDETRGVSIDRPIERRPAQAERGCADICTLYNDHTNAGKWTSSYLPGSNKAVAVAQPATRLCRVDAGVQQGVQDIQRMQTYYMVCPVTVGLAIAIVHTDI